MTVLPQIDGAFILAAGMGTRMGPVGQALPKPLWPLPGGISLLEWQCQQLLSLGIMRIMVNVHHQRTLMYTAIEDIKHRYPQLTILVSDEPQLLDVGGGVHQMCRRLPSPYTGRYLLLNVDYLWQLNLHHLKLLAAQLSPSTAAVLQLTKVAQDATYNRIKFSSSFDFQSVLSPSSPQASQWTYAGVALLQLNCLAHQGEPIAASSFFNSIVCPAVKTKVAIPGISEALVGHDVGTLTQYGDYVRNILMDTTEQPLILFMPYLQGQLHLTWEDGQYRANLIL